MVKNYGLYTKSIYQEIIDQEDAMKVKKFGQVGSFPLLISVGEGVINIIYYLQLTSNNLLTKKSSTF